MRAEGLVAIVANLILVVCFSAILPLAASAGEEGAMPSIARRLVDLGCLGRSSSEPSGADLAAALKGCPLIDPVFRIEGGFNSAKINRVSADRDCRIIATASEDKTARVFRGDGHLLSVLRPPIGPGNGGKLRAVAVSPDGRIVVAGGWDVLPPGKSGTTVPDASGNDGVYVFDPNTGALLKRIGGFPYDLKHLVFSPDGSRLAVTMGGNVFVLETQGFKPLYHDGTLQDMPYGAAFGPDNSLFVGSLDGDVRKYDATGKIVAHVRFKKLQRLYGLAVEPWGRAVVVTSIDVPGATFLDVSSLKTIGYLDVTGIANMPLGDIATTADASFATGGLYFDVSKQAGMVRIWKSGASGGFIDIPIPKESISAIAPCGHGFLLASVQPSLTLVDQDGHVQWRKDSASMRAYGKTGHAFLASRDGHRLWFGLGQGETDPAEFDLDSERLFRNPKPGDDLFPPVVDRLPVTGWEESGDPKLAGRSLQHDVDELFRSMAQQPDGAGFALGSEFQLWFYDQSGRVLWPVKPPAPVYGVNISRDGRLLVAAYGDGTIRWHRLSDGGELLALYVDAKSLAWIAWTPTGYFMSSPGGDELAGWHLNRGFGNAADFFPLSRFRSRFYRPDIVKLVLEKLDEKAAINAADAATEGGSAPGSNLIDRLPPVVTIFSPPESAAVAPGKLVVEYTIRSPSGAPADQIEALINGRPADVRQRPPAATPADAAAHGTLELPLPADVSGPVEIGLIARAAGAQSSVAKVHIEVTPSTSAPSPDDLLKPKLFALVVGVSDYKLPGVAPLKFAAKDAADFEHMLKRQESGGLYGPVEVRTLTNSGATTAAIKEGLVWLDENVTRHDVGMVFFAGHGQTDARNRFWFLTADTDKSKIAATALSREDINVTLQSLRGRVVVFLDACHAGSAVPDGGGASADMNALLGDLAASGQELVVYSSSAGRELSYESPAWQNGAFTKSVLEAIAEGKADLFKTGRITSSLLDAYAVQRVGVLTEGRQHPIMFRPQQSADFDIAVVR